jgi:hypothetical protein
MTAIHKRAVRQGFPPFSADRHAVQVAARLHEADPHAAAVTDVCQHSLLPPPAESVAAHQKLMSHSVQRAVQQESRHACHRVWLAQLSPSSQLSSVAAAELTDSSPEAEMHALQVSPAASHSSVKR